MPLEAIPGEHAFPRPASGSDEVIAVLPCRRLLSLVQEGLQHIGAAPARPMELSEAVARLVGPGRPPRGILCEPQPDAAGWGALQTAAGDPFNPTPILLLGGPESPSDDPDALMAALRALTGRHDPSETEEVAALRRGLAEGDVALRYQPIVRIADRVPVGVEGLVRWLRRDGEGGPVPIGPDSFVPMAERQGLALALARAVGLIATGEMRALRPSLTLPVSINLPLEVLLRRDTAPWLDGLCRSAALRPEMLGIELTETTPVRDILTLRRAVDRLRRAGHPVWIDDMSLEERRDALLDLPFTGLKLDRHLVGATVRHRRARAEVERLVGHAHRRGMLVTAEGVTGGTLWHTMAAMGVDRAQGFAVGRPLPAATLPAWAAAWRAARGPLHPVET